MVTKSIDGGKAKGDMTAVSRYLGTISIPGMPQADNRVDDGRFCACQAATRRWTITVYIILMLGIPLTGTTALTATRDMGGAVLSFTELGLGNPSDRDPS
jgi:hypothetical protein